MLPTRPQLQGWNPDSLTPAGAGVAAAGESVYQTVGGLEDDIERMPEAGAWSGKSHAAATGMFRRATTRASNFMSYAEGVGAAFKNGDASIGGARHWLLGAAADIDSGELTVNDAWVVLIKPAQMSEAKVAELEAQAAREQAHINDLLVKVGEADEQTAAALQAVAQQYGFAVPDQSGSWLGLADSGPGDQVPDPRQPAGMEAQKMIRDADKATTKRNSVVKFDAQGSRITEMTMQDGSKQVVEVLGPRYLNNATQEAMRVTHYDRHGELISQTDTKRYWDGSEESNIIWGDGTQVITRKAADGTPTGQVNTADGRHAILPDEFFTHPALTTVGGGFTALETQAERGIPMLSQASTANLGSAAKFAGPAVGVATALYDTVTASTLREACVQAFTGAAGVAGGEVGAPVGVALAAPFAEVPGVVPIAAMGGSMIGGWTFGYVGGIVGNVVCRP